MSPGNSGLEIVPYLAPARWYAVYMAARIGGADDSAAVRAADSAWKARGMRRRDFCRAVVAGARGQQPLTLSVPIAGGADAVKHSNPAVWQLSQHGRWQHVHLGALEAAYSATVMFAEYGPRLREIIIAAEGSFRSLSLRLHHLALRMLAAEENIEGLGSLKLSNPKLFAQVVAEKSEDVTYEMSVFDVIFRKGRDAVFALCHDMLGNNPVTAFLHDN